MRREFIELQATLKPDSKITEVCWKNDRLYFKVDGHQFATAGMYVLSDKHPAFVAIMDNVARNHNTAEGIEEQEKSQEEIGNKVNLFLEYRAMFLRYFFMSALGVYKTYGEERFLKFVDKYVEVMLEEDGDKLLNRIVDEYKKDINKN